MSIGHDVCQKLMDCNDVNELNEAMKIINDFYRVYYQHLEIKGYLDMHLRVALVDVDTGRYRVMVRKE